MKVFFNSALLMSVATLLAACASTSGDATLGRGCTGFDKELALRNDDMMQDIRLGMSDYQLYRTANAPQWQESIALQNGAYVDVWFYRTKTSDCATTPTMSDNFTPIILEKRQVVAMGQRAYQERIMPYIRRVGS